MKSILHTAVLLLLFTLSGSMVVSAQTTVSIQPGYTNQTFYSMNNGVVSSVSNTDWDLGFQLRGFGASVLINSKNNVRLYKAQKSAVEWPNIVAGDTTNILNAGNELLNSDTSWDFGAFNVTNNAADPFDLGWGEYDFNTHNVNGDSVYFIQLSGGDWHKFMITSLAGGFYNFKWADLDGSNEQTRSINKATYAGKYFVYYSITNDITIDREPAYNAWDLSFAQYMAVTPIIYKVTGVLANDSVEIARAYPVDIATASPVGLQFSSLINTIGYDWKSYDFSTNTWTITDSLVYFVTDRQGMIWKMVFTGFDGASTGNFYFDQTAVVTALDETTIQSLGLYPNPASDAARLMLNSKTNSSATLMLTDVSGRIISSEALELHNGIQSVDLNIQGLAAGLYQVVVINGAEHQTERLVIR